MLTIYQIAFYTGILYSIVSFVFGGLLHFVDFHIDTHLDGDVPFFTVSPLKPSTIAAFVTAFGGIGILGTRLNKGFTFTLIAAIIAALIASSFVYFLVILPLYKAQSTTIADHEKINGLPAVVTSPILENSFGEISYFVNDIKFTGPAKYIGKGYLGAGEEVYIVYVEENVFYVDTINPGSAPH